jgi:1,4-dihydroxy-2-naphthoyl-CoA hydrolase
MTEQERVEAVNALRTTTLMGALGMEITVIKEGYIEATMPVDARTHQPYGLLHGGASAALAETIGSFGSHLLVEKEGGIAVGVELNINHLKSKRHGLVTGKGTIIHQGRSSHVWNIEICDENGGRLAVSRLTVMVKRKGE